MAEEAGAFNFDDVSRTISQKMVRRHPHVFGNAPIRTADEQTVAWEQVKAQERAAKGPQSEGLLDGIALGLPALTRAVKLSARAATVGFVWRSIADVVAKLHEEVAELEVELAVGDRQIDPRHDRLRAEGFTYSFEDDGGHRLLSRSRALEHPRPETPTGGPRPRRRTRSHSAPAAKPRNHLRAER